MGGVFSLGTILLAHEARQAQSSTDKVFYILNYVSNSIVTQVLTDDKRNC